ncbi:MAG TPA: hypothetical protein VG796_20175 [Verrucomicrobiales bacterium]|nr:hypothetical protein [Verrucomicrobiales bacterium]
MKPLARKAALIAGVAVLVPVVFFAGTATLRESAPPRKSAARFITQASDTPADHAPANSDRVGRHATRRAGTTTGRIKIDGMGWVDVNDPANTGRFHFSTDYEF